MPDGPYGGRHSLVAPARRAHAGEAGGRAPKPGRRWWPRVLVVAVVAAGISVATPAGRHQWALSFVRQPTPYTALSFLDAAHLPAAVAPGAVLPLGFAVANHEGHAVGYRYAVTSAAGGQTPAVLAQGVLAVGAGATAAQTLDVVPRCAGSPCQVEVSLPGTADHIDVQMTVQAGPG